jgi:hypothetical protein
MCRRRGRAFLQNSWNQAAQEAGAADLRISSDIVDGDIGQHLHKFKYMERSYHLCVLWSLILLDPFSFHEPVVMMISGQFLMWIQGLSLHVHARRVKEHLDVTVRQNQKSRMKEGISYMPTAG